MTNDGLSETSPLVSVIVPTMNSARTLKKCLASVREQTYNSIEVIVVDGGSTDDSLRISWEMGCRAFAQVGMGMAEATDFGLRMARGKYVYRVDSDVVLDTRLVEEAVSLAEDGPSDAISVLWLPDESMSYWARVRRLEKECYKGDFAHSGIRFIRKDVAEAIGGWSKGIVAGEDYDFYNRFRNRSYTARAIDAHETHLGEPLSIIEAIEKQYRYGRTLRQFFRVSRGQGIIQMSPFRLALVHNWRKFARNPGLSCGYVFYTMMIYIAAILGMLSDAIHHKGGSV